MTAVFLKLVELGLQAIPLILAVVVFRLLLKPAPKWVRVLLWGMVGLRLVCPFSIESALSLIPRTEPISSALSSGFQPTSGTVIEPEIPATSPVLPPASLPETTAGNPMETLVLVLSFIWLAGMVGMLLYAGVSYFRLRQRVSTAVRMQNPQVDVFQSEFVSSPFVMGLFRPRIYLPYHLEEPVQQAVLAHESAHIARRDHWWKPLGFLILAVYWFHPLVWLAYLLFCRDLELACDEKVIRRMEGVQRADYSQALLMASVHPKAISACPLAFGEVGIRQRVQAVLHYRKPAFWVVLLALIGCGAVAVGFLTNRPDKLSLEETAGRYTAAVQESISRNGEEIAFTLPEAFPDGVTVNLHLAGRGEYEGGFTSSLHFLEEEEGSWRAGETYRIPDDPAYVELNLDLFFTGADGEKADKTIDLLAVLSSDASSETSAVGSPAENVTVSSVQLPNGMELRLVLTEGRTFSQDETVPGGGIYPENAQGSYVLQVWREEEMLSQLKEELLPLSGDGSTLNFAPDFSIALADYNGDGQQDFALSQWLSGSNSICLLFSVDETGSLSVLPVEGTLMVSGQEFSPLFAMEEPDCFSFDQYDSEKGTLVGRLARWDGQKFVVEERPAAVLSAASAGECIRQVLDSLTLYEDNTVSFSLPPEIPVSEDGKTQLTINLSATFSDEPGSFSVQSLLDWETGWTGGQVYRGTLDTERGRLTDVTLSVFFMTEEDPGLYHQYAGGSMELTPPFSYGKPAGYTPPSVEIARAEDKTLLTYTLTDGQKVTLSLKLPDALRVEVPAEQVGPYDLLLTRNGTAVGMVSLWGLGTTDEAVLETVAGSDDLPMPVFSTVALSNHAGYEEYQVQQRSETGATATAKYVWQDLSASSGDAASLPWQSQDCVLAYDWQILPFFVEIRMEEGICTDSQLETLARELAWMVP